MRARSRGEVAIPFVDFFSKAWRTYSASSKITVYTVPICVAFIALDHLDDPGTAVSLEGLGILVLAALLGHSQGIPNDPLDLVGGTLGDPCVRCRSR
jgi:hypothetical protein